MAGYDDGNAFEKGKFEAYFDEIKFSSDWGSAPRIRDHYSPDIVNWGASDTVSVDVYDSDIMWDYGDTLSYQWRSAVGDIVDVDDRLTAYTAPESGEGALIDTVICSISDKGLHTIEDTMLIVVGDSGFLAVRELSQPLELSCSPNPSNAGVDIAYSVPTGAPVKLAVYDLLGRQVCVLLDSERPEHNRRTIHWNGGGVSSGIYFCRLSSGRESRMAKIVMLK